MPMPKKYRYILTSLLILVVFIIHQSLILKLDWRFNFWPVILTFILFIFDYKLALFWGIGIGFLLDIFSTLPFGSHLIILFLIVLFLYLLTKHLITKRSFLSILILTLMATFLYDILLYFIKLLIRSNGLNKIIIINLNTIFVQLVSNSILIFLLFIITLYFTRRLNTDLIVRK